MQYGIEIVPFGEFGEPQVVVQLAQAAEAAGWEAVWVWDHLAFPYGVGDPWVLLTAVATTTTQIKLLPGVAALPRYKPHLLARLLTSLDRLSTDDFILGAGMGALHEFTSVGEAGDYKTRAAMLDEGLDLLTRIWSGQPVTHHGAHYTVNDLTFLPQPIQQPRIPIWIGGDSAAALRRAAQWDGWIMGTVDENCVTTTTPAQIGECVAAIRQQRTSDAPFAIAVNGVSQPNETAHVRAYEAAGATWWFEAVLGCLSVDEMLAGVCRRSTLSLCAAAY
ncbi:MAG: LLM class flavin-dependent oxidoreductase [Chloroflexota bacterium]